MGDASFVLNTRDGYRQMGQPLEWAYDRLVTFGGDLYVVGQGVPPLRWDGREWVEIARTI